MITNDQYAIKEAKESALIAIDSINTISEKVKSGKYTGRLYSKLIDAKPIEKTLELIHAYGELASLAAKYDGVSDLEVPQKMEDATNKFFDALIKIKDHESNEVIEQLLKISVYALDLIKKMPRISLSIQQNLLNNDILITVLTNCEVPDIINFGKVCKYFYKIINNIIEMKEPESKIVIEQLLKTSDYALDLIKKIPEIPVSIQQGFLNKDILVIILSKCEMTDLLKAGEVCKLFYKITNNDNNIWKFFCLRDYPEKNNNYIKNFKQFYIENEKVSYRDCIGNDIVKLWDTNDRNRSIGTVQIKLDSSKISAKNIKKLIKLEHNLNLELDEMFLFCGDNLTGRLTAPCYPNSSKSTLDFLKERKIVFLTIKLKDGTLTAVKNILKGNEIVVNLPSVQKDNDNTIEVFEDEPKNDNACRCLIL